MIEKTLSARLGNLLNRVGMLNVFRRCLHHMTRILQGGIKRIEISTRIINDTQPPEHVPAPLTQSAVAKALNVQSKRLWVFNPYTLWELHAGADITMAKIAHQYGAHVTYMTCDSLARCCEMYRLGDREMKDRCGSCQAGAAAFLKSMEMPWVWISRYVPPAVQVHARAWVDQMQPDDLPLAVHDGKPIGQWARGSVMSRQRLSYLNMANEQTVFAFREYLYGSVLAYEAAKAFIECEKPDVLLLFNGRMAFPRAVFEVAQEAKIRTVVHERGMTTSTIQLWLNETCLGNHGFWKKFQAWKDVPLTQEQANASAQWLCDRRTGSNLSWPSFVNTSTTRQNTFDNLGLDPSLPLVVLLTSSDDEIVLEKDFGGIFEAQSDWIRDTIELFRHRPNVQLVIRMHPNISGMHAKIANQDLYDDVKALAKNLPEHIKIVWPEEKVDTYALIDASGLGLVYGTTAGIEMSALGKAVLLASKCHYYQQPLVTTVISQSSYPEQLNKLIDAYSMTPSLEIAAYSRRFIAYILLGNSYDLPGVRYNGYYNLKLEYQPEYFDKYVEKYTQTCEYILQTLFSNNEIYPNPGPEDIARSADAERSVIEASLVAFKSDPPVSSRDK